MISTAECISTCMRYQPRSFRVSGMQGEKQTISLRCFWSITFRLHFLRNFNLLEYQALEQLLPSSMVEARAPCVMLPA